MALDWTAIQIFLKVVRAGSFREAARGTPMTQPTISRRMHALEESLRVQLFHRFARGVRLTPAGDGILNAALEMERASRYLETIAAKETELSGSVRLWVTDGIGGYWLPPRMSDFHKCYPGITVDVLCSETVPSVDMMAADVVASWHVPTHPDLVVLSENTMILRPCASREYLQVFGIPQSIDDLRRHRICDHLHYPRVGEWRVWADIVNSCPNICYRTNSSMALGEATIHGVGISLQPIGVFEREPGLVPLDLEGLSPTMTFWLTCHKEMKDIPRVRSLVDYLRSSLFRPTPPGAPFQRGGNA